MCFDIYLKEKPKCQVAEEDIIVCKTLYKKGFDNIFFSPVKSHIYVPDKLQKRVKIRPRRGHPFFGRNEVCKWEINRGYHFFLLSYPFFSLYARGEKKVKCIIPKGTKYIINKKCDLGVAERIICTGEIIP